MTKKRACDGPVRFERQVGSERRLYGPGIGRVGFVIGEAMLTLEFEEDCPLLSADAVTQVVEEFDDGESLLGCPVVGDQEVESVGQAGRLIIKFHALLPAIALRFRARCSARSRASLWR